MDSELWASQIISELFDEKKECRQNNSEAKSDISLNNSTEQLSHGSERGAEVCSFTNSHSTSFTTEESPVHILTNNNSCELTGGKEITRHDNGDCDITSFSQNQVNLFPTHLNEDRNPMPMEGRYNENVTCLPRQDVEKEIKTDLSISRKDKFGTEFESFLEGNLNHKLISEFNCIKGYKMSLHERSVSTGDVKTLVSKNCNYVEFSNSFRHHSSDAERKRKKGFRDAFTMTTPSCGISKSFPSKEDSDVKTNYRNHKIFELKCLLKRDRLRRVFQSNLSPKNIIKKVECYFEIDSAFVSCCRNFANFITVCCLCPLYSMSSGCFEIFLFAFFLASSYLYVTCRNFSFQFLKAFSSNDLNEEVPPNIKMYIQKCVYEAMESRKVDNLYAYQSKTPDSQAKPIKSTLEDVPSTVLSTSSKKTKAGNNTLFENYVNQEYRKITLHNLKENPVQKTLSKCCSDLSSDHIFVLPRILNSTFNEIDSNDGENQIQHRYPEEILDTFSTKNQELADNSPIESVSTKSLMKDSFVPAFCLSESKDHNTKLSELNNSDYKPSVVSDDFSVVGTSKSTEECFEYSTDTALSQVFEKKCCLYEISDNDRLKSSATEIVSDSINSPNNSSNYDSMEVNYSKNTTNPRYLSDVSSFANMDSPETFRKMPKKFQLSGFPNDPVSNLDSSETHTHSSSDNIQIYNNLNSSETSNRRTNNTISSEILCDDYVNERMSNPFREATKKSVRCCFEDKECLSRLSSDGISSLSSEPFQVETKTDAEESETKFSTPLKRSSKGHKKKKRVNLTPRISAVLNSWKTLQRHCGVIGLNGGNPYRKHYSDL